MNADVYFWFYVAHFFLEWGIIMAEVVEKIKALILCSIFFFKSCRLWDNVGKGVAEPWQYNTAHVIFMLDN